MRMVLCLMVAALLAVTPRAASGQGPVETGFLDRSVEVDGLTYPYQVYVPASYDPAKEWPVILFLHGSGERGDDGMRQTAVGLGSAIRWDPDGWEAIVVMPQAPADSSWQGDPAEAALAALSATEAELSTDPDRVYLTGLSLGGNGVWYLAYEHPDRWAAVVPICGWVDRDGILTVGPDDAASRFDAVAARLAHLPVWLWHGEMDTAVPVEESRRMAKALEDAGADVRFTELLGVGHNAWDAAYGSESLRDWLFRQRRGGVDGVSVLTLNIWHNQQDWPARLEAIVSGVERLDPDIVCLQEVLQNPELPNQARTLADRLGYRAYFASWDSAGSAKRYGNAVLTRDPMSDSGFVLLDPPDDYRVVAHVRVDPGDGPLDVYCTHLHHTQERPEIRRAQIESAVAFIEETRGSGPVVLAGDFNARVGDPELAALQSGYTDTFGTLKEDADSITTLNPALGHSARRIDHVFVAPGAESKLVPISGARVLDQTVDGVWPTDHFGVLVRFHREALWERVRDR